jgi:hypothetical protein
MSTDDGQSNGGNGAGQDEQAAESQEGVELVTVQDENGKGIYLSCAAETSPQDLVDGLCALLSQVMRAVVARPQAKRVGDLGLGDDVF